jgi:2-polyprenyl-6-hydroxyphenyl methylase/3-demethylubiquinone-9 3-methyltransferase
MARTDPINNRFYNELGERWYTAQDDPVALLRAEGKVKNSWVSEKLGALFSKKIKILDVGCGAGFLANHLAEHRHQVTGLDASTESLAVAKSHDLTSSVIYQKGDAYYLPFSDQSFDAVCTMDFLEHVEAPEKIVAEAARVLRPGGVFFFHTFNRNLLSYLIILKGVEWFVKNTPKDMHLYSYFIKPKELERFCLQNKLTVKEWCGIRPKILKKPFWKMLWTREVPEDFEFTLTSSTLLGYLGLAIRD